MANSNENKKTSKNFNITRDPKKGKGLSDFSDSESETEYEEIEGKLYKKNRPKVTFNPTITREETKSSFIAPKDLPIDVKVEPKSKGLIFNPDYQPLPKASSSTTSDDLGFPSGAQILSKIYNQSRDNLDAKKKPLEESSIFPTSKITFKTALTRADSPVSNLKLGETLKTNIKSQIKPEQESLILSSPQTASRLRSIVSNVASTSSIKSDIPKITMRTSQKLINRPQSEDISNRPISNLAIKTAVRSGSSNQESQLKRTQSLPQGLNIDPNPIHLSKADVVCLVGSSIVIGAIGGILARSFFSR